MEKRIGPYILCRRTEYSKYQLFDAKTGQNLSNDYAKILAKMVNDYELQTSYPNSCFNIKDNCLAGVDEDTMKDVEYVFVPDEIVRIEERAFHSFPLSQICLPASLTEIYANAFRSCEKLSNLYLPDSVRVIGKHAFSGCTSLNHIDFSPSLCTIAAYAFLNCTNLKELNFPDSLITISESAFTGCTGLKNIKWSKNLESIGNCAFSKCTGLEEITIPETIKEIPSECFYKCESLKEVYIPNNILDIGELAFSRCEALRAVKLPEKLVALRNEIFFGCRKIENLTIPDSVIKLSEKAFYNMYGIKTINIPRNLEYIDLPIFTESNSIETLKINSDLKNIKGLSIDKESLPGLFNLDLITLSNIEELIIDKSVNFIEPDLFGLSGSKIKKIRYYGTQKEFDEFKKNNEELFKNLTSIENISFADDRIFESNKSLTESR